ncbi:hypothetical protein GCM10027590_59930 [Nocardiopsis nanhaiensis]
MRLDRRPGLLLTGKRPLIGVPMALAQKDRAIGPAPGAGRGARVRRPHRHIAREQGIRTLDVALRTQVSIVTGIQAYWVVTLTCY